MERKPAAWQWIVAVLAFLIVMAAIAIMGGIVEAPTLGWLNCPPKPVPA